MSEWQCRFCGVTSELTGARLRQASASHLLNNHQDELNALPGNWPALPSGDHVIQEERP